ncbi:cupin domain-containing protein [Qingshengfaniella alkalisoli]|uniref:Cupin domain-containing protein n=1 Tax=Qingshengfaniella alkalisoli TaxID=2599296 RepID=A0A5B8IA47_9RHOB|nr:cupin domain-containing protein [Qingshengfaniella alkalisoli]QDY71285.1 cupin domain-containing protein [Qingshengfaniella alkalisoli]
MPRILRENQTFPEWCELREFQIFEVGQSSQQFLRTRQSERIVAANGGIVVRQGSKGIVLSPGQFLDILPGTRTVEISGLSETATAVRLAGEWGNELGGCGVFSAKDVAAPKDGGDPVTYPKSTCIDSHYHDCDEYWIILEGRATVVVQNEAAEMAPGDCLCIGMGRHHDMPQAPEPVTAIYFETGLGRQKRIGHLWEHTHGQANPAEGRD